MSILELALRAHRQAEEEAREEKIEELSRIIEGRLGVVPFPYLQTDGIMVQAEEFFFSLSHDADSIFISYGPNYENSTGLGWVDVDNLDLETLGRLLTQKGIK